MDTGDSARDRLTLSSLEFKRFPPPSRQFRVFCHLQAFVIDVPYLQFISAHCAALDAPLSLKSGYEEWVQIQIFHINRPPLPPWVNHSV